jgi:hypothetical protein
MEKITYSPDNCFVCSEFMGEFRNELTISTVYSDRQIYEIIEELFSLNFDEEIVKDAGICQNCFIKFNDYAEHIAESNRIHVELLETFEASQVEQNSVKPETIVQAVVFEEEASEQIPQEEMYVAEEAGTMTENDPIIVEYDWMDNNPNEFGDVKPKLNRSDEGFTIIKADHDLKLYQCDVCLKTSFAQRAGKPSRLKPVCDHTKGSTIRHICTVTSAEKPTLRSQS